MALCDARNSAMHLLHCHALLSGLGSLAGCLGLNIFNIDWSVSLPSSHLGFMVATWLNFPWEIFGKWPGFINLIIQGAWVYRGWLDMPSH